MTDLHEILYCSVLAPDQSASVVGQIASQARSRNAARDVSGILVFDGLRFCEHLEGPRDVILRLMDQIGQDPRHVDVQVLYNGALDQRRYRRFDMGLSDSEDVDHLAEIQQLDGDAALARFLALRPGFDVNG